MKENENVTAIGYWEMLFYVHFPKGVFAPHGT
jgi:hypothetical protein